VFFVEELLNKYSSHTNANVFSDAQCYRPLPVLLEGESSGADTGVGGEAGEQWPQHVSSEHRGVLAMNPALFRRLSRVYDAQDETESTSLAALYLAESHGTAH
jgi:hypothetical protein